MRISDEKVQRIINGELFVGGGIAGDLAADLLDARAESEKHLRACVAMGELWRQAEARLAAARIEGARLALEAARQAVRSAPVEVTPNGVDGAMTIQNAVNAIGRLDPTAIVKP